MAKIWLLDYEYVAKLLDYLCIYLFIFIYSISFIHIDTNNWRLKVPGTYQAELFGQIPLPESPRQKTFLASAGFESIEESVTLSDAPRRLAK